MHASVAAGPGRLETLKKDEGFSWKCFDGRPDSGPVPSRAKVLKALGKPLCKY